MAEHPETEADALAGLEGAVVDGVRIETPFQHADAMESIEKDIEGEYEKARSVLEEHLILKASWVTGRVIGECLPRHRASEFVKFLDTIDAAVPTGLEVHVILDNYATHKHATVTRWLACHPRVHFHFTPTSSSWLNLVERWFRELTDKALRRGVFGSVPDLITAIEDYLAAHNNNPRPLVWTATAESILTKVARGRVTLNRETKSGTHH